MSSRSSEELRLRDPLHRSLQSKLAQENHFRTRQKTTPMPVTGYDAAAIEEFYDRRPFQVGWRLNSVGIPLLGKEHFNA
jgi:hypothetical protein